MATAAQSRPLAQPAAGGFRLRAVRSVSGDCPSKSRSPRRARDENPHRRQYVSAAQPGWLRGDVALLGPSRTRPRQRRARADDRFHARSRSWPRAGRPTGQSRVALVLARPSFPTPRSGGAAGSPRRKSSAPTETIRRRGGIAGSLVPRTKSRASSSGAFVFFFKAPLASLIEGRPSIKARARCKRRNIADRLAHRPVVSRRRPA